MTISSIVDTMTNALDSARTPSSILPPLLLYCLAIKRPGVSAYKRASKVIANNKLLGIPTEDNPDGSPNMINQFIYNMSKTFEEEERNDRAIHGVIPAGTMLIQATGANGGGPVTCVGTNLTDITVHAIPR